MGNETSLASFFPYMNLMSTPRDHSRIRTVISSSNIDFQGSVPKRMPFSHADDLRARAPLLGWLERLGYGGSVVFSFAQGTTAC